METIDLDDTVANINESKCIGCGVCAHHCPEEAIHLERIGPRHVFIPPKKIEVE
jgi:ferredoxin